MKISRRKFLAASTAATALVNRTQTQYRHQQVAAPICFEERAIWSGIPDEVFAISEEDLLAAGSPIETRYQHRQVAASLAVTQ